MKQDKITSILKELHAVSGFRISLYDMNSNEIASYPETEHPFCSFIQSANEGELELCERCNKNAFEKAIAEHRTVIFECRHNLTEAISPLYNYGILIGFLRMGQVRKDGESINSMLLTLSSLGKQDFESREICSSIPVLDDTTIKSYVNIITTCANYLTLSNAIIPPKATIGQLTMKYISEKYTERISIKDICDAIGYSKSTVLSAFKKEFSTTVNSYLVTLRLEKSKKMLKNENISINQIALACGFSDQSYFSKVFTASYGITPTNYRKEL